MRIDKDHLYHGAALIQIAEHPQFTAINSLRIDGVPLSNSYKINDGIGVHLKYASKPTNSLDEYPFTFHQDVLRELAETNKVVDKLFIALVCVEDMEICCLAYDELCELVEKRRARKGSEETQYVILVTAHTGKRLRAYIKAPGMRKTPLGRPRVIGRSVYPRVLFESRAEV